VEQAGLIKMDCLETSRGCTHACSFCSPGAVYPCRYRTHSPEYVLGEVRRLAAAGVTYCMLTDDHFGGDLERTERLCRRIVDAGIRIAFFCFIRPFTGHLDLKRLMVAAGFVFLSYGAESPAKSQLNRYGKGYPGAFEYLRQVNAEWLEAGAKYIGNSYVFGDPKDSLSTLQELGAYARRLDCTFIEPLYSQPYPGTRYRDELAAEGLLRDRGWGDFTESRLLVEHPEVPDDDAMRRLRARMWLQFFTPRKAAGVVRGPLYFHRHIGLPVLTVLRYMKACDYIVFGCLLENKPYQDLRETMVHEWFRDHLPTFEPEEMTLDDMCPQSDDFADMVGLRLVKRWLGRRDVVVTVLDGVVALGALVVSLRDGRVAAARAYAGAAPPPPPERVPTSAVALPIDTLVAMLGVHGRRRQVVARVRFALGMAVGLLCTR